MSDKDDDGDLCRTSLPISSPGVYSWSHCLSEEKLLFLKFQQQQKITDGVAHKRDGLLEGEKIQERKSSLLSTCCDESIELHTDDTDSFPNMSKEFSCPNCHNRNNSYQSNTYRYHSTNQSDIYFDRNRKNSLSNAAQKIKRSLSFRSRNLISKSSNDSEKLDKESCSNKETRSRWEEARRKWDAAKCRRDRARKSNRFRVVRSSIKQNESFLDYWSLRVYNTF